MFVRGGMLDLGRRDCVVVVFLQESFQREMSLLTKAVFASLLPFFSLSKWQQTQRIDKHQLFILSALRIGHI